MKKLLITATLFLFLNISYGQQNLSQDVNFDNLKFINFRDSNGNLDGTRIGRYGGGALRLQYNVNLAFDALSNGPINITNNTGTVVIRLNPSGTSYFNSGSIGIGTTTTGSHKLAVEGSIGAREIRVEAGTWSDFVSVSYTHLTLPTTSRV